MMQYCINQDSFGTKEKIITASVGADVQETNGDTTCLPYGRVSYATAGYFSMGGFILAACMIGYTFIDRYKQLVRKNSFKKGWALVIGK